MILKYFATTIDKTNHPEFLTDTAQLFEKHKDKLVEIFPGMQSTLLEYELFYHVNESVRIVDDELAKPLVNMILAHAEQLLTGLGYDLRNTELFVSNMWLNKMGKGGTSPKHAHGNCFLTGCYYIKVPKNAPPINFFNPVYNIRRAQLPMLVPNKDTSPAISLCPEEGEMLMWESYLDHEVPALEHEDERWCIAFDVFGKYNGSVAESGLLQQS